MINKRSALIVTATAVSALTAGTAQALTIYEDETTQFDFYGRVHMIVENDDSGPEFENQSSRLGLKFRHVITPEIAAFANAELRYEADERTEGEVETRNTFIGVESPLGSIYAGNFDSIYNTQVSDILNVDENRGFRSFNDGSERGRGDSIAFDSATFSGFSFGVSAKLQNEDEDEDGIIVQEEATTAQAYLAYEIGPVKLALGYDQANDKFADGVEDSLYGLAAAYQATDKLELGALYETQGDIDHYGVSSAYDYGKGDIYGLVSYADDAANGLNDTQYLIGVSYKLSKPFYVYVEYADSTGREVRGPGHINALTQDYLTLGARYSW